MRLFAMTMRRPRVRGASAHVVVAPARVTVCRSMGPGKDERHLEIRAEAGDVRVDIVLPDAEADTLALIAELTEAIDWREERA